MAHHRYRRKFISESSLFRILNGFHLVSSPVFLLVSAKDKYEKPTRRVNELWQTDFTQLKMQGWGWYYRSTLLDDCSRFILARKLSRTRDVQDMLELTINETDLKRG